MCGAQAQAQTEVDGERHADFIPVYMERRRICADCYTQWDERVRRFSHCGRCNQRNERPLKTSFCAPCAKALAENRRLSGQYDEHSIRFAA